MGCIVVADSVFCLHSNFRGGRRKTHVFSSRLHNGPSRSSKVVHFGINKRASATSYSSSIVTLVSCCPVSEILQVFCGEVQPHPYCTHMSGLFPLDWIAEFVALMCKNHKLITRVLNLEVVQPICTWYLHFTDGRTDRQTDGRTDDLR